MLINTPFQTIQQAIVEQRISEALDLLARHASSLSTAELGSVGLRLGALIDPSTAAVELILTSSSNPMEMANLLRANFAAGGMQVTVRDTGYDQWRFVLREEKQSESGSAVRLLLCMLDATIAYPRMAIDVDLERLAHVLSTVGDEIEDALRHTEDKGTVVILNTVPVPASQFDALLDFRARARAARLWHYFNGRLLSLVDTFAHVQVLDSIHVLQSRVTDGCFWDARMATVAGVNWTPDAMRAFADACVRTAKAVLGRARKCLVLDLDNTLWGGVLGDDGVDGIDIYDGSQGNAHARLQQAAVALGRQGVILAVCSKNELGLVEECFAQREMPLKRDDLAMLVANWQPKPDNLRHIVSALNIHQDSMVFVDDSEFECALVRETLPAVRVVEIGDEPSLAVEMLLGDGVFDRVSITDDDRNRNRSYATEAKREELRAGSQDYSDYLSRLELVVSVRQVSSRDVQRAAQLSQRTNQFNLSGRRFTETELVQRIDSRDCVDLLFSVRDRLGEYGTVGAVFARHDGTRLYIQNMVLSCRVFSRGIEHFMLAEVADRARLRGCEVMRSVYVETPRNRQFKRFHTDCGFEVTSCEAPGEWFALQLSQSPKVPSWISRLD